MARRKRSFFKVLLGDFSNQLQIPPAFLGHFDGNVPQHPHLRTSSGTWRVDVEKVSNRLFFQQGWKKFVHDNGLKLGEFLVFRYVGNLGFYVDIYGRNGCKKEVVMALRKRAEMPHEEGHGYREIPRHHGQHNADKQDLKGIPIKVEVTDDTESETSMNPLARSTWKATLQKDHAFESGNPIFQVAMRHSYIYKCFLSLPATFVKEHLSEQPSKVTLRVLDGRTWPVNLVFQEDVRRCSFMSGWRTFVRENGLEVGDTGVFVLTNKVEFIFEVVLYRKAEAANRTMSLGKP